MHTAAAIHKNAHPCFATAQSDIPAAAPVQSSAAPPILLRRRFNWPRLARGLFFIAAFCRDRARKSKADAKDGRRLDDLAGVAVCAGPHRQARPFGRSLAFGKAGKVEHMPADVGEVLDSVAAFPHLTF